MKIILTQEVTGLGSPGELVEVKDGYGRNYLLPQGKAIVATKGAEKQMSDIKRARSARAARDLDHAREMAEALSALRVRLALPAGSGGRLFGSVTGSDVVEAVANVGGPKLDKRRIIFDAGHIKNTGKYLIKVRLHEEVIQEFPIEVSARKEK